MIARYLLLVIFLLCNLSCGQHSNKETENVTAVATNSIEQTDIQENQSSSEQFSPFYVFQDKGSRENHFIPSGFMPDGKCVVVNEASTENCRDGKSCIKIIFDVACANQNQKWAGVYWQYPANNWGQRKGGFNLTGAKKLVFWARGDKGGEQIQEFTIGGIMGTYPDSDMGTIGPVILTPDWREYTIDLRGKDLSYINGGFAWTTNSDVNPESCIFYLDDMRFE